MSEVKKAAAVTSWSMAARAGDHHSCRLTTPAKEPHVGGLLSDPTRDVHINGKSAVVFGDAGICIGAPDASPIDHLFGGNLNVFINGSPAARVGDATFKGNVDSEGSPDVWHRDGQIALSKYAADWLVRYLSQLKEIPFAFPKKACEGRAHMMWKILDKKFGIPMQKQFIGGDLRARVGIVKAPWDWHVAPMVASVSDPSRVDGDFWIIDPSMDPNRAMRPTEWSAAVKGVGGTITHLPGPVEARTYKLNSPTPEYDDTFDKTKEAIAEAQKLLTNDPDLTANYKRLFDGDPRPKVPPPHQGIAIDPD